MCSMMRAADEVQRANKTRDMLISRCVLVILSEQHLVANTPPPKQQRSTPNKPLRAGGKDGI